MSIYTYLRADHRKVKELIRKIQKLSSTEKKNEIFNELKEQILVHSKAEEKIFYSPLSHYQLTEEEIAHAKKEHKEVEEKLERLSDPKLHGAAWDQLFKNMASALEHHIDEEENKIFSDAKEELSLEKSTQMEWAMKKEKEMLQQRLHFKPRG